MSSVACTDGQITVTRREEDKDGYKMRYRIFRPMSKDMPPMVVLHGGPSIPSDYLYPLVDFLPYRKIIFYDQIGCGRSDVPKDVNLYSISNSLNDLENLLNELEIHQFHLYGQSFGGILAYEYLKRNARQRTSTKASCLSVILSSTPTSVPLVEKEARSLQQILFNEDNDKTTLGERFRKRHQCRLPSMPMPLIDAYANAGTVWRGTAAIPDYIASPPSLPSREEWKMPPVLILRGEYDFVTDDCVKDWNNVLPSDCSMKLCVLKGCSHHGLLENGRLYGDTINSFLKEHDSQ